MPGLSRILRMGYWKSWPSGWQLSLLGDFFAPEYKSMQALLQLVIMFSLIWLKPDDLAQYTDDTNNLQQDCVGKMIFFFPFFPATFLEILEQMRRNHWCKTHFSMGGCFPHNSPEQWKWRMHSLFWLWVWQWCHEARCACSDRISTTRGLPHPLHYAKLSEAHLLADEFFTALLAKLNVEKPNAYEVVILKIKKYIYIFIAAEKSLFTVSKLLSLAAFCEVDCG